MKLKIYRLAFCLLMVCPTIKLTAQTSYPRYDLFLNRLRNAGDSIMFAQRSVSPAEAAQQLLSDHSRSLTLPVGKKPGKLSDTKVYNKVKPAVLIIGMLYRGAKDTASRVNVASGYVISASGTCVTNYHVMYAFSHSPEGGKYSLVATNGLGNAFAVSRILYSSAQDDLAVLQLDLGNTKAIPYLTLAENDPDIGSTAYALGHPQGVFYFFSKGIIASAFSDQIPLINAKGYAERKTLAVTADFGTGSSGGPVLDKWGQVIATVSSTRTISQEALGRSIPQMVVKNAIPVSSLKRLLSTTTDIQPRNSPINKN